MTQAELVREEKEKQLNVLAQELYASHERAFLPLYPWVFVRVLKKDQTYKGLLHLPETDQNKTIHEGIVLGTWEPCRRSEWRESQLYPGAHVLFPHWAGLPIAGYSTERYRVIREEEWKENEQGGLFAIVEYKDESIRERLKKILAEGYAEDYAVDKIVDQFLLVDRDGMSVTLSGR